MQSVQRVVSMSQCTAVPQRKLTVILFQVHIKANYFDTAFCITLLLMFCKVMLRILYCMPIAQLIKNVFHHTDTDTRVFKITYIIVYFFLFFFYV